MLNAQTKSFKEIRKKLEKAIYYFQLEKGELSFFEWLWFRKSVKNEKIQAFLMQDKQDDVIDSVWDYIKQSINSDAKDYEIEIYKYCYTCIVNDFFNLKSSASKQKLEKSVANLFNSNNISNIDFSHLHFSVYDLRNLAILSNNDILFKLLLKITPASKHIEKRINQDNLEMMITEMSQNKTLVIDNFDILSQLPDEIKKQLSSLIQNSQTSKSNKTVENYHENKTQDLVKSETQLKAAIIKEETPTIVVTPDLEEFFHDKLQFSNRIEDLNKLVLQYPHFFSHYEDSLEFIFKELKFITKNINLDIFHETLFISNEVNNLVKKTLPNLFNSFVKIMKIEETGKHVKDFQENLILVQRYLVDCHEFLISVLQQDFTQSSHVLSSKFGEFNMPDMIKKDGQQSNVKGNVYVQT